MPKALTAEELIGKFHKKRKKRFCHCANENNAVRFSSLQKADKRAVALKVARTDFDATIAEIRRKLDGIMEKFEEQVELDPSEFSCSFSMKSFYFRRNFGGKAINKSCQNWM